MILFAKPTFSKKMKRKAQVERNLNKEIKNLTKE